MENRKYRIWLWLTVCAALIPPLVYVLALVPGYISLSSDIQTRDSFVTELLYHMTFVLNLIRLTVTASLILAVHARVGFRKTIPQYAVCAAAVVLQRVGSFLSDVIPGGIPDEAGLMIASLVGSILSELVVYAVLLLVRRWYDKQYQARLEVRRKAQRYFQDLDAEEGCAEYPYPAFFDLGSGILGCIFWVCLTIVLELAVSAVVVDVQLGLPGSFIEWMSVIWLYLSFAVTGCLAYLFMRWLTGQLLKEKQ